MSVGKSINRTDLRSLNGGEMSQDNSGHLLGSSGSNTILTNPARQCPGAIPLSTTPTSEGPQFHPCQVMSTVGLRRRELDRGGLKAGVTRRLEVTLENTTTVAQENPERPPQLSTRTITIDKR